MDAVRFDTIVRSLSAGASRRGISRVLAGLALSAPLSALVGRTDAAAKKKKGKGKKKKKCKGGTKKCGKKCIPSTNCCTTADCDDGESCQSGSCTATCAPQCGGKECGSDGCGGSCGSCDDGASCLNGTCTSSCVPDCAGKTCGDDGCNGSCGSCTDGKICQDGTCDCQNGEQVCDGQCIAPIPCGSGHCGCGEVCAGSVCQPGGCPTFDFCNQDGYYQCGPGINCQCVTSIDGTNACVDWAASQCRSCSSDATCTSALGQPAVCIPDGELCGCSGGIPTHCAPVGCPGDAPRRAQGRSGASRMKKKKLAP